MGNGEFCLKGMVITMIIMLLVMMGLIIMAIIFIDCIPELDLILLTTFG